MTTFTEAVCEDGAAILKDGRLMAPEEILDCLQALDGLVKLKVYRDTVGKTPFYNDEKPRRWARAFAALDSKPHPQVERDEFLAAGQPPLTQDEIDGIGV